MKKEAKVLLTKAVDSLVLSVDRFNSAWDKGREEAVLILLDRSFELLLKAIIVHRGGAIREPRAKETIGFDKCVRKCLSDEKVQCLNEDSAITIQVINSLRDAAQHYILDISEQQLYLYSQAGLTLFSNLLSETFGIDLHSFVPGRVLPVSSAAPQNLEAMIRSEFSEIQALLKPGARKHFQARAKVRSLAIIESSLSGIRSQPGDHELDKTLSKIAGGEKWNNMFPGMARLRLDTDPTGPSISIRLSKTQGEPVRLVPEGTPGATIVAVHKVDLLGYYSMGLKSLAENVGLSAPLTLALVKNLGLQNTEDCFRVFKIGNSTFKRYSPKAVEELKKAIPSMDMQKVWTEYVTSRKQSKKAI